MRLLFCCLVIFFVALGSAFSMDFSDPDAPFSPSTLTRKEIRFLQAGLTIKRHYFDDLDGLWGRKSQEALEKFIRIDLNEDHAPTNLDVMQLAVTTVVEFRLLGWSQTTFPGVELTLLTPQLQADESNGSDEGESYFMGDMALRRLVLSRSEMRATHKKSDPSAELIYSIRQKRIWASFVDYTDGVVFVYSRNNRGNWNTILVAAEREDVGRLLLVIAPLFRGNSVDIEPSNRFNRLTDRFLEEFDQAQATEEEKKPPRQNGSGNGKTRKEDDPRGTGTGFAVNAEGYLLTNAHVVKECRALKVRGKPAFIVDKDENFDLALVHVPDLEPAGIAIFADTPAALNSDITTAGFPLSGLLGGLNITRGTVAARKGLGGSGVNMQITAPLQPGNSGGPAVNASGQVVGVVVAKLNATAIAEAIGDIPQNVNFAIRGTIAQLFLHQNGITPQKAVSGEPLAPEEIASRLSAYTFLINCF